MMHRIAAILAILSLATAVDRAAAQAPATKPAAPSQTEIRKQLIDATKELAESLKALATAEAAAVDAKVEAEKARSQTESLRAKVAKLNRQLLDAAQATQAIVARGGPRGAAGLERENADPQDPYERFAILTPGGPVVVQVALTIDGQPFRTVREKFIDEMLAAADRDKDGKATWDEALDSPRFTLGRLRLTSDQQKQPFVRGLDRNADGLVDRPEVRLFVAQTFGAPTFSLGGYSTAYGGFAGNVVVVNGQVIATGGGQADVRALLDLDADGV
ncbi:MAG TPA: hypothetical protein VFV87_06815, partial [Pirellulaceae bacterium]|nr:hypothetical protein [Pirellulaceae bacterium]